MQPSNFEDFTVWLAARNRRLKGRDMAALTLAAYRGRLSSVANKFQLRTPEDVATLLERRSDVEQCLDRLHAELKTGSVRNIVYALVEYGGYLKAQGVCRAVTLTRDDAPAGSEPVAHRYYTPDELELLCSAARGRGLRWWAFTCFLADTGRRVGEVLAMEWDRFHLDETPAFVELPRTKNGRPNYVPLTKRLAEQVFTPENIIGLKHDDTGFAMKLRRSPLKHPFPWGYPTVRGRMMIFCRDVGVPHKGLHAFRHAHATRLLAKGVPLHAVSKLLGHASVAQTDRTYNSTHALDFARYLD